MVPAFLEMETRIMMNDNFNRWCEELLATHTPSDQQAVARRLESLRNSVRQAGDHVVQTVFGGSVRRGTDVAGLSDVDALLIVDESSLRNRPPAEVITYVGDVIRGQILFSVFGTVTTGDLAVTVNYFDGTEIQLLPAIRTASGGVRIPEPGSSGWSNVVRPERFAKELSSVNRATDGRLTPTIKLAKAMADCHITRQDKKISGYHMEALAIDAFRNYGDSQDPRSMLIHFLGHSIEAVMRPIADSTGQSRHVDEYLGPAQSRRREGARTHFGQMRGKIRSCSTRAEFNALFCIGD